MLISMKKIFIKKFNTLEYLAFQQEILRIYMSNNFATYTIYYMWFVCGIYLLQEFREIR